MHDFINKLMTRHVFRAAAAYLVVAWLLAQVAQLVLDSFEAPAWIMQTILILMGIGLPIVLFLSWAFELTPEGIKREEDVDRSRPPPPGAARKFNLVIIGLLVIAVAYFVADKLRQSSAPAAQAASIAVLPFANRSTEPDTQYFVDGIHDDLLTQLARLNDLKVISRTSVMEYRDTTKNLRQIGKELGVSTLLEGAVQRSGNRVRVTAQLIDAATDEHLWADTYDRDLSPANIFDIQTEIAKAIAGELSATLNPSPAGKALDQIPTQNLEAYDLYLRARAIPMDGPAEDLKRGIELARKAVELDPKFALAMGQIAENYINIYWFTTQKEEDRDLAQHWIDRALAIAPDDPRLQFIMGELLYAGYLDYDAALEALEKAREGMPGVSSVYLNLGAVLRRKGDFAGATKAFEKAESLDPRDAFSFAHHIFTFIYSGDVEGAKRQAQRILALPTATQVHISFTKLPALFMLGDTKPMAEYLASDRNVDLGPEVQLKVFVPFLDKRYDDALAALALLPDPIVGQENLWTHSFVRARILHAQGRLDEAREQARKAVAELDAIAASMPKNPRPVAARAMMQAILGNESEARADAALAERLYPLKKDMLDGPDYIAEGIKALAVFASSKEVADRLGRYLALPAKQYYIDYLLLDPVFARHLDNPAIRALRERYSLRSKAH